MSMSVASSVIGQNSGIEAIQRVVAEACDSDGELNTIVFKHGKLDVKYPIAIRPRRTSRAPRLEKEVFEAIYARHIRILHIPTGKEGVIQDASFSSRSQMKSQPLVKCSVLDNEEMSTKSFSYVEIVPSIRLNKRVFILHSNKNRHIYYRAEIVSVLPDRNNRLKSIIVDWVDFKNAERSTIYLLGKSPLPKVLPFVDDACGDGQITSKYKVQINWKGELGPGYVFCEGGLGRRR